MAKIRVRADHITDNGPEGEWVEVIFDTSDVFMAYKHPDSGLTVCTMRNQNEDDIILDMDFEAYAAIEFADAPHMNTAGKIMA